MSHSHNYIEKVNSRILDNSIKIELKPRNKKVMVQDWINKNHNKNECEEETYINNIVESWKLENLQENVNNYKFPSVGTLNDMTLKQTLAYEAMLINILDITPSNVDTSVNILYHLKIISNNQLYKFRIFE